MPKLDDRFVKSLTAPETDNEIFYDGEHKRAVTGFGIRVTSAGTKSFVFNYRIHGRERRLTIGRYGLDAWTVEHARKRAGELRRMVDNGKDPLGERTEARRAPTMDDLCDVFVDEHLGKRRPTTQKEYKAIVKTYIRPALKHLKVAAVTTDDVEALHRKITKAGAPYRANRTLAVLSKMFTLAIRKRWLTENPAKGIERNQEHKRTRYLKLDELARLGAALSQLEDQQAANIIRLLLLTGARRGEVQAARWDQLDLEAGVWTKPGATTKQKTEHRVPLSAPACQLLAEIRSAAEEQAKERGEELPAHVFPGRAREHRVEIKGTWAALCKAANITNARPHDLRHTFASLLVSSGFGLPMIGALLGHTQPVTTARYAHLFDDPLRQATERAGAIVTGKPSAEVIGFGKQRA